MNDSEHGLARCEDIKKIKELIYGKEGILSCLREKVPKKWLWTFVTTFGIVILFGLAQTYHHIAGADDRYMTKADGKKIEDTQDQIRLQATIIEEKVRTIQEELKEAQVESKERHKEVMDKLEELAK
jgi:hypothetical protein